MNDHQDTTFKKACFFTRVSTNSQQVELQVKAAARYRELYSEEDTILINEFGVSSNKVSMKNRKHLQKLIEMVKREEIHTLFVYDRSRLTRRFYEYFFLYNLFWEHEVKVVFTTNAGLYPPFSRDIVTEGINALLTEEEGKNISRRSTDIFKKAPNQKFGYFLEKDNGRQYLFCPKYDSVIQEYFEKVRDINNLADLFQAATNLKKVSNRPLQMIFSMIIDPFYCGHEMSNDKLYTLPYVKPYITVEQFKENIQKFEPLLRQLALNQTELGLQNVFNVKCGNCDKELKFSFDAISNEAHYECKCARKKNKRVRYDVQEISKVVATTVLNYFHQVDSNYLKSSSIRALKSIEEKLASQRKRLASELREKEVTLALLDLSRVHPANIQKDLSAIKQLKTDCMAIDMDISLCSLASNQIREQIRIIEQRLFTSFSEEELISLAPSIIEEIIAYNDKIEVIQFFSDGIQPTETVQIVEVTKE